MTKVAYGTLTDNGMLPQRAATLTKRIEQLRDVHVYGSLREYPHVCEVWPTWSFKAASGWEALSRLQTMLSGVNIPIQIAQCCGEFQQYYRPSLLSRRQIILHVKLNAIPAKTRAIDLAFVMRARKFDEDPARIERSYQALGWKRNKHFRG